MVCYRVTGWCAIGICVDFDPVAVVLHAYEKVKRSALLKLCNNVLCCGRRGAAWAGQVQSSSRFRYLRCAYGGWLDGAR